MTVNRSSSEGILRLLMLVLLCNVLSCQSIAHAGRKEVGEKRGLMKLHHLPFRARTYVPVTIDSIEESSSFRIWLYGKNPAIEEILSILRSNPTQKYIDKGEIRLKVFQEKSGSQTTLFVDMHGVVMDAGTGIRWQVDAAQLDELTRMIEGFHGIVDQRPTVDLFD